TAEQTDNNESPIINGVETTDYQNIIALYGKKPGAEKGVLCTSTVVAPTVLLTAAHCVSPATAGEGNVYVALTGPNLLDHDHPSPRIDVAEVHWDPQFNAQNLQAGHDIAVVILATPTTIAPLKINRSSLT